MKKSMGSLLSDLFLVSGIIICISPIILYWFIHGDVDRYIWIINGPFPFSNFGGGPFQLLMYIALFIAGAVLIVVSLISKRILKNQFKEDIVKKFSLVISVLLLALITDGCSTESNQDYIAKQINIEMPDVLNIEYMDDHVGFHGDGQKFAKIEFDNIDGLNILSQIEKDYRWNRLPLTENLNLIMYGGVKDNVEYTDKFTEKLGIPEIKNGYWYFIDRHSESIHPEKDTELFDRHSFNFTLAMYDVDNTLFYFEFDT